MIILGLTSMSMRHAARYKMNKWNKW